MGVAAAVRHEHVVRHERETHREAGERATVPRRGVNCTQAGRSTQSVRLGKCLKHKAKGSHPLFRKGKNVPSSQRPIVPLRWFEFAKNRESSILLLYIIIIIYNNKIIITPLSPTCGRSLMGRWDVVTLGRNQVCNPPPVHSPN